MEGVVRKNIRLKISTKRVETGGECVYQSLVIESTRNGSARSEVGQLHNRAVFSSDDKKRSPAVHRQSMSSLTGNKRGPLEMAEGQQEKRQKIDTVMKELCRKILKQLMNRKDGWIFSKPVDPVELDLPDYFSIITEPMDLGTIRTNLAKNKYRATEDFAADVRLTFANAMHYNPPGNRVHQAASVLSTSFEEKWKILNVNCSHGSSNTEVKQISERQMKEIQDTCHKAPPLIKIKRSEEKVGLAKTANCKSSMPSKNICKGTGSLSRLASCSINAKPHLNLVTCKCGKSGCTKCRSSISSQSTHTTLSDISSDRSMVGDSRASTTDPVKQECQIKSSSVSHTSQSDQDSEGTVSALDEESLCHSSQVTIPANNSTSIEGWNSPLFDVQLSPEKALRAAKLKKRFADTILKAQQKTLLDHGEKVDLTKLQRESEKLEKRQREERATMEAKIKAAMAAKHQRTETELKRQRERAREAARMAVEKVVKTVELEENVRIVKELEVLGCSKVACGQPKGAVIRNPLEQLGLFIKPEYMIGDDLDDDVNHNFEEGEIL